MADESALTYRLSAYEGPLDLLYRLIQANKIDICDIPIFQLTEQYISFLDKAEHRDMDSMSEFTLLAATLLEIKSRMLLPRQSEDGGEDPRQQLVDSIIEYRRAKLGAEFLSSREKEGGGAFFKPPERELISSMKPRETLEDILCDLTPVALFRIYKDVLSRKELKIDRIRSSFKAVRKDMFTIQEKAAFILGLLSGRGKVSFRTVIEGCGSKIEGVVSFLALLELAKGKEVSLRQSHPFQDIEIRKCAE